jgi:hypothetical protein
LICKLFIYLLNFDGRFYYWQLGCWDSIYNWNKRIPLLQMKEHTYFCSVTSSQRFKHPITLIKFNTCAVNWHCCTHSIISMSESLSQYSSVLFHISKTEWRMWANDLGDDVLDSEQWNMNEVYAKSAQEQQLQWQRYKGYCMMMVFWTVLPPKNKKIFCHTMTPATHKSTNCCKHSH